MPPGPRSSAEAAASRTFVAEVQASIKGLMKKRGVNRTELARRLGVAPSRITTLLAGNMTLETASRIYYALGAKRVTVSFTEKENGNGNGNTK